MSKKHSQNEIIHKVAEKTRDIIEQFVPQASQAVNIGNIFSLSKMAVGTSVNRFTDNINPNIIESELKQYANWYYKVYTELKGLSEIAINQASEVEYEAYWTIAENLALLSLVFVQLAFICKFHPTTLSLEIQQSAIQHQFKTIVPFMGPPYKKELGKLGDITKKMILTVQSAPTDLKNIETYDEALFTALTISHELDITNIFRKIKSDEGRESNDWSRWQKANHIPDDIPSPNEFRTRMNIIMLTSEKDTIKIHKLKALIADFHEWEFDNPALNGSTNIAQQFLKVLEDVADNLRVLGETHVQMGGMCWKDQQIHSNGSSKSNKILNPMTGRWVKKSGKIGRKLLKY
jgi:dimeric dUTPase (all-alpha-NTP-PPase superfamily)